MNTPAPVGASAASQTPAAPTPDTESPDIAVDTSVATEDKPPVDGKPAGEAAKPLEGGKTLSQLIEEETDPAKLDALLLQLEAEEAKGTKPAAADKKPETGKLKPETEDKPADDDEEATAAPLRLWMKSLPTADRALFNTAVQMIREAKNGGKVLSARDAIAQLIGTTPAPSTDQAKATPDAAKPTEDKPVESKAAHFDTEIEKVKATITDLETKQAEARRQYDDKLGDDLLRQINRAERQMERLEDQKAEAIATEDADRKEQEAAATFDAGYTKAKSVALRILPDSATPGTADYDAVTREIARLEQEDPAALDDPNYPIDVALKIAEAKKNKPLSDEDILPPAPLRSARDVPPLVGAEATTQRPMDREALIQKIEGMSLEELDQLADAVGTKAPDKSRLKQADLNRR